MTTDQRFKQGLVLGIIGVILIAFLETLAMMKGIDGSMFGFAIGGIGGVIGWFFKTLTISIKRKK
jgi:hypothetical protein